MKVTEQCRDAKQLNQLVQVMLAAALTEIRKNRISPLLVETYRPKERQYYLFGKGRTVRQCTEAGVPQKYAGKYAKPGDAKVTWTLNSIHIQRKAVDLIPLRKGKAIWNAADKDTQAIISIMKKYGFEAGADWKGTPDSAHFQVKGVYKSVFMAGKANDYVTRVLQKALKKKNYYTGKIDGIWGTATTKAVNQFRKANGWIPNGKIGKVGLKKLLSLL